MKLKITAMLLACAMLLAAAAMTSCNKSKDKDPKDSNNADIPLLTPGQSTEEEDPVDPTATTEATTAATVATTAATTKPEDPAATTTAATTAATTTEKTTAATTVATTAALKFTECDDTVYVITTALNVRTSPDLTDNIYTQVKQGEALRRTGYTDNWCRVIIDEKEYYVSATYVSTEDPNATLEFSVRYETVYVTAENLYIREAPSSTGAIVDTVTKGTEMIRVGYHEDWSKVMYNNKLYYCGTKYLSTTNPLVVETTTVPAVG